MASLSPNRRPRTNDERVRLIVLHATYMASDDEAIARLCDPSTEVSCHYYLKRSGEVVQLVEDSDVAWHAGKSRWVFPTGEEIEGLNGHSLGVEIGNAGPFAAGVPTPAQEQTPDWAKAEPFTEAQYTGLAALLKTLMQRHGLRLEAIVGHSQIAPGRKSDPGPHFDWVKLHALVLN